MKEFFNKISAWLLSHRVPMHFALGALLCLYIALYDFAAALFLPFFLVFVKEILVAIVKGEPFEVLLSNVVATILGVAVSAAPVFILMSR